MLLARRPPAFRLRTLRESGSWRKLQCCLQNKQGRSRKEAPGLNVAAHQEKEKNKETKTSKRKTREERRQAADFTEAACCPSAVVQGAAWQKNALWEGSARGNWDPRKTNSYFDPTQTGSGTAPPHSGSC